jgi:hypothetical protein
MVIASVFLTSFEPVNRCMTHIKHFTYKYIIIDVAHKIKNEEAMIERASNNCYLEHLYRTQLI